MIYDVNTNCKPVTINLNVESINNDKRKLIVAGFDTENINTIYFFREIFVLDKQDFTFNLPLSPKVLHIVIYDFEENKPYEKNSVYFNVNEVKINELKLKILNYHKRVIDFVNFAINFSLQAGYIKPDIYFDKNKQYEIRFFEEIRDVVTEEIIPTPARIHKTENYIEVSKAYFDKLTIPSRVMILLHEFAHNYLNVEQDNEVEADIKGLKVYLDCQFDVIQSIYAFTQIFYDSKQAKERLDTIMSYLSIYEQKKFDKNYYKDIYDLIKNT
jgi:hypothetical protein